MDVRRVRTIAVSLIAVAALVMIVETTGERALNPQAVTAWFASLRDAWYALPLVAVAFAVLGALFVPVMFLIAATGIAFGPWLGSVYAMTGSLVSGSVGFGVGRWIGRERVERLIGKQVPRLSRALNRHGTLAVFFIRKIPLPFMLVNIAIGASSVRYRDFLFGTLLGMTAAVIALAGFGGTFVDLVRNPSPALAAAAVGLVAVPMSIAWAINTVLTRRSRRGSIAHLVRQRSRFAIRDHALTICLLSVFVAMVAVQCWAGHSQFNDQLREHGWPPIGLGAYLVTGHFWSSVFENWQSEFLEMAAFLVLTAKLVQKGSAESRRPGALELSDADPRRFKARPDAPWPVRRGGWILWLYERSLGFAFALLFLGSWTGQAWSGWREAAVDAAMKQQPVPTFVAFITSSDFWFRSSQNWQSEFLGIAAMVWLSVYLRQRGSPESKPVHASHAETGR